MSTIHSCKTILPMTHRRGQGPSCRESQERDVLSPSRLTRPPRGEPHTVAARLMNIPSRSDTGGRHPWSTGAATTTTSPSRTRRVRHTSTWSPGCRVGCIDSPDTSSTNSLEVAQAATSSDTLEPATTHPRLRSTMRSVPGHIRPPGLHGHALKGLA